MGTASRGLEAARAVKAKARRAYAKAAPVCGVGITRRRGVYAVQVNLESEPECGFDLPVAIDGVPIVVRVVGEIRKQPRRRRARA